MVNISIAVIKNKDQKPDLCLNTPKQSTNWNTKGSTIELIRIKSGKVDRRIYYRIERDSSFGQGGRAETEDLL